MEVTWCCYYFLFEKKMVKCFVPMSRICPVTAKLASQQQISSQHCTPLPICVKNVRSLQCYLVAMVIHVQSLRSQIYVYIYIYKHILHSIEMLVGPKK